MFSRLTPALCVLLVAGMVQSGLAQAPKPDSARRPARLFRATEPVEMWLAADFKQVFKDRDSMSTKRYPAVLRYLGDKKDTLSLDVQLATRGHYRLKASSCAVPPLKVYFDKEKTRGGLFGGQGSLKLSTHCQKADAYAQNLYIEYSIYGMYNALTPISLRARLATVHWSDPKDPGFAITRPGFWTEDDDEMAGRNGGKVLMQQGGHAAEMDERQMAITDVFQYMIGNTDFSLMMLHNYRIVVMDSVPSYMPMAYDFDWSGLVDAPYARPDYRLPIKRVTDRLYRGGCHTMETLQTTVAYFQARKADIYGTLTGIKGLDPRRLKDATDYLDDFYKFVADPGNLNREFRRVCDT